MERLGRFPLKKKGVYEAPSVPQYNSLSYTVVGEAVLHPPPETFLLLFIAPTEDAP
jgi:hypothetical protein